MTPSRPTGATSLDNAGIAGPGPRAEFVLAAGLLFALGFSRMFRKWLFDDFDGILGDQGDARILIALLEHWYRSFSGNWSDWLNPPFFYPVRGALGFTMPIFSMPSATCRCGSLVSTSSPRSCW